MTGRELVGAGIRFLGLWWLLYEAPSYGYFIVVKELGLQTSSKLPVALDIQSAVYDVLVGVAILILAPIITLAVCGPVKRSSPKPADMAG